MSGNGNYIDWPNKMDLGEESNCPRVKLPPTVVVTSAKVENARPRVKLPPAVDPTPAPNSTTAKHAEAKAIQMSRKSSFEKCAVFAKSVHGPLNACHKSLSADADEKIESTLVCARNPDAAPWVGIRLYLHLGTDQIENEAMGRGVRHVAAPDTTKIGDPVKVSDYDEIDIRLYRGQYLWSVEKASSDVVARFPGLKPKALESGITVLTLRIMDGEKAEIVGFGWPCVNPSEPKIDDWVHKNMPVIADITLLKLFQAREFHLVVAQAPDMVVKKLIHDDLMPADFKYSYGDDHKWNPDLYLEQQVKCRGQTQFLAAFNWMAKPAPEDGIPHNFEAMSLSTPREVTQLRQLPVVNFLDIEDERYVEALLSQALPQDRVRFRHYMSERPLGIGIMTAGPGFGKTTAVAVATLAMQASLGKILCSAPTNIAVDTFAERIDGISIKVAALYNEGKEADDPARSRQRLVVRAYKLDTEVRAFMRLLQDPNKGNTAAPVESRWRLNLSLAFWVLSLFGNGSFAPGTRAIDPDASEALAEIKAQYTDLPEYETLLALLGGSITFEEYRGEGIVKGEKIAALMVSILNRADMLCTTPSATERCTELKIWKNGCAKGIVIDEAANMHRADMYCVWGNTLTPMFLAGDPRQLPPTVISSTTKDAEGNFLHRLANDCRISGLAFIQASGCPVYRLKCQLRMGKGLFDIISKEIYPDVPSTYAEKCNVDMAKFESGHLLEAFVRNKYPGIKAPPASKFSPVFVHYPNARVWEDGRSGSKKCKQQVSVAVKFAFELVTTGGVRAKDITIISPYAANIEHIGRVRKQPKYAAALVEMEEACTVHGYQGRENDIVIIVMGTSAATGPGFTSDENRLNVCLTRQRTGLVIVGDIDAAGALDQDKKKKGHKIDTITVTDFAGNIMRTKALVLRSVHRQLRDSGRVVEAKMCKGEGEEE